MIVFQGKHGYEALKAFNKFYSDAHDAYRQLNNVYRQKKNKDGVYVTNQDAVQVSAYLQSHIHVIHSITLRSATDPLLGYQSDILSYINGLPMFAAWRNSLDIYKIDPEIFEEMLKARIPEETPASIFKRLPSFCSYIEFPRDISYKEILNNGIYDAITAKGCWVYLGYEPNNPHKAIQLNICADVEVPDGMASNFDYISLVLEDGLTVKQATERVFEQYTGYDTEDHRLLAARNDQSVMYAFLPIILWLCMEEPDISSRVNEPVPREELIKAKYSIHKKTGLFVPPSTPTVYHLGERLGSKIREYKERIKQASPDGRGLGVSKTPHIRQGHYHGYWLGKKGQRYFDVKWVAATFVGL